MAHDYLRRVPSYGGSPREASAARSTAAPGARRTSDSDRLSSYIRRPRPPWRRPRPRPQGGRDLRASSTVRRRRSRAGRRARASTTRARGFCRALELRLAGERPLLLSSTVREDNAVLTIDLTNPGRAPADGRALPRGRPARLPFEVSLEGACYERHARRAIHGAPPCDVTLAFTFDADFADIFEVRGTRRERRGERLPARGRRATDVLLRYSAWTASCGGRASRSTPAPHDRRRDGRASSCGCSRGSRVELDLLRVTCESDAMRRLTRAATCGALRGAGRTLDARLGALAAADGGSRSNEQVNDVARAIDRRPAMMITTETPDGPYPYAGVPWFSTAFGRDGIITALECSGWIPASRAACSASSPPPRPTRAWTGKDAEPGKILHETRSGEMAALGEIPFGRYYGSVDATPLFVMLAGALLRAHRRPRIHRVALAAHRARAGWIDRYGDRDGDGFVEYHAPHATTAWSSRAGRTRTTRSSTPTARWRRRRSRSARCRATCTRRRLARRGDRRRARRSRRRAAALREAGRGSCASGSRRRSGARTSAPMRSRSTATSDRAACASSNAGQCLFTGIAVPERARASPSALMADDMFSGLGHADHRRRRRRATTRCRTTTARSGRTTTRLIALGLGAIRPHRLAATDCSTGMFEASLLCRSAPHAGAVLRLPGRPGEGPTLYPVARPPQAWAAGAVLLLFEAASDFGYRVRNAEWCFRALSCLNR